MKMRIKTLKKRENLFVLNASCLLEDGISLTAKGLYAYLMSLPDNQSVDMASLLRHSKDDSSVIYSAIDELSAFSYLELEKQERDSKVKKEVNYIIHEEPKIKRPVPSKKKADYPPKKSDHSSHETQVNPRSGQSLTKQQERFVEQQVDQDLHCLSGYSKEKLLAEVIFSLLDKHSFSNTEQHFKRKTGAIFKCIKNGSWTTPLSFVSKQVKIPDEKEKIRKRILALDSEKQAEKDVLKRFEGLAGYDGIYGSVVKKIKLLDDEIACLKEKIKSEEKGEER